MPEYTVPEIQRTSLTAVVLTLKCLGIHDVIRYTDTYFVSIDFGKIFPYCLYSLFIVFANSFISFKVSLSGFTRREVYSRSTKTALSI